MEQSIYAGFWIRLLATVFDGVIILVFILLSSMLVFSLLPPPPSHFLPAGFFHSIIFLLILFFGPFFYTTLFWQFKGATPGKMMVGLKIVNAKTSRTPSVRSLVCRYFAYILSAIPLCLGFLWVAWSEDKKGLHDKLSGTAVIYSSRAKLFENEP